MFAVELAGRRFLIDHKYDYIYKLCSSYYAAENTGRLISVTDEEIAQEQTGAFPLDYLESIAICRKIADDLILDDTLLFHGSAIAVDGEVYLFTAASGYGKSTHARLWCEVFGDRAVMINDDKPFLRVGENGVTVYGSPWDGKHHLSTNTSAPLKAICILERSETNRLEPIPTAMAIPMMIRGTHRPPDPVLLKKTLELIEKCSENINTYRMFCNMDPEAARVAYEGMCERK